MAYKFQLGKAKLSGSIETAQAITSQGGLTVVGAVALDANQIDNAELAGGITNDKLVNSTISGKQLGASLDTLSAAADGGLSAFSYDGSGAVTVALTSSIAGAGLTWSSGVLSVNTGEIEGTISGSVRAAVADFVEGSDFVTFDDVNGTIGVNGDLFSGSFSAALASKSTSHVAEGTNKYFTGERARAAISLVDNGGDGSLVYNSGSGVFTYTGPSASEARAHFSALTSSAYQNGNISYNSATGQITLQPVEESWVRQRLSAADAVKYNIATGVVSLTLSGSSLTQSADGLKVAEPWVRGRLSAGAGLDYNGDTGVFSVGTGEVTNEMLFGSIANSKLINSAVSVVAGSGLTNGGSVSLGGSVTLNVAAATANAIVVSEDGIDLMSTIAGDRNFTGLVKINNLNVTGTLTTINTQNLEVADARILMASGSTVWSTEVGFDFGSHEGHGTLLTADVNIDGVSGVEHVLSSSLPLVAPAIKATSLYGNLVGSMQLNVVTKAVDYTLLSGDNVVKVTANKIMTLPASPVLGQEHKIKCFVAEGDSPAVVVSGPIEGTSPGVTVSSITLESFGAAASFVWDGSAWMIF
jgi:hypothetical protein